MNAGVLVSLNPERLAKGQKLWHDEAMLQPKRKATMKPVPKEKKLPSKNPSDPMKLARSVVEPLRPKRKRKAAKK
ncbi:hypothetical protein COMA2_170015 [Candidatus Nitrospira nitrificans]|uniref:Uncharacterized protein n=1 Tax=Candidatus Nitrospira nitrificans TaxID=1742973 RepID=A0A0S4LD04_9BACT|nr:hypothetical protein COMA2_170015 [Candidatus Nitrospira nitrificans]